MKEGKIKDYFTLNLVETMEEFSEMSLPWWERYCFIMRNWLTPVGSLDKEEYEYFIDTLNRLGIN